jgi:hypothetical protein
VGKPLPPFAAPLAAGGLVGDADLATHTNAGAAGRVPACQERGTGILNICQLYQRGPVAVALVVVGSSCVRMLRELAAALPQFPGLQVAGVAVRGNRAAAARLARELPFPLGYDRDGAIATVYEAVACPQLTLAYPGGVVAAKPLYVTPSQAALDARLRTFYRSSIARGWKAPRK